jgi:hypothetical protein
VLVRTNTTADAFSFCSAAPALLGVELAELLDSSRKASVLCGSTLLPLQSRTLLVL